MRAASNRTFICSVVFLDIVEYSRKPVSEQIQLKERLNALLTGALANVALNDRIILDTGDGVALSFIGDPEDALFVGLTLRDALAAPPPHGPRLTMRIGINLGPVKLVKDINGHPNIIGDGINVAQRVMSFSQPGQVLVSRSYYEVVSCLSEEYVKLFHYAGSRTDKHVREHEVYVVQATDEALQRVAAVTTSRKKAAAAQSGPIDKLSRSASFVTGYLRHKPQFSTALAVIAILAVAVGLRMSRQSPGAPVATPSPPAKVTAAPTPAAAKETSKTAPMKAAPMQPAAAPAAETSKAAAEEPAAAAPVKKPPAEASPKAAAPGAPALLVFAISPWGEVYVNGGKHGVAPPLRDLKLKPGRYLIEIRNADFPPYVEVVDAKPGSRIRIRHKFR